MISQFCQWLDATPLSQAFQSLVWFVPGAASLLLAVTIIVAGRWIAYI